MCFGPELDFGYSLERFIEAVLTCADNLYVVSKNKNKAKTFSTEIIVFASGKDHSILYIGGFIEYPHIIF